MSLDLQGHRRIDARLRLGRRNHADPLIDIDLGAARAIGKVTFSSITGSGGVTFPLAVRVFVSTDAKHYDLLCDMPPNRPRISF
ncbi:MAG: hypothetical protein Ct9H300mP1_16410 [Planctomycetaceae bacterium]|nr:MAG: hypothetical protein Ct9H300mP1_16410 [Planctomycetaceae bacterium]